MLRASSLLFLLLASCQLFINAVGADCAQDNSCVPAEACGDGVLEEGEACDDGNNSNGDGCSSACVLENCGDGAVNNAGAEECDDGNNADGDGCSSLCQAEDLPVCGDGLLDVGESCDDGNLTDGDGCSSACALENCGDAIVDAGEECDDGNQTNGDGCDQNCRTEGCGNTTLNPGEVCFDNALTVNVTPGSGPVSVALGDFDGDDDLDIATVNKDSDSVGVFLNDGSGQSFAEISSPVADEPVWLAVADLNKDTTLDILTVSNLSSIAGNDEATLLFGDGAGLFPVFTNEFVGAQASEVVVGDIDDDEDLDFVSADALADAVGADTVSIVRQNLDGTFAPREVFDANGAPESLALGDFDGDEDLDIVTAGDAQDEIAVIFQGAPLGGSLSFAAPEVFSMGTTPLSVVAFDVEGDGDLDVATANAGSDNVTLRENDGGGDFPFPFVFSVGDAPQMLLSEDINGDSLPDLLIVNQGSDNLSLLINTGQDGQDAFSAEGARAVGDAPVALAVGDLNGDGALDIVTVHPGDFLSVLLSNP